MKPDVLESNLARLFAAAWRPVAPSARFRSDLEARLAREIAAGAPRRAAFPAPARVVRLAAALLALLGAVAAGFALLGRDGRSDSLANLIARGECALRAGGAGDGEAGGWRAADAIELARGYESGDAAVEAHTPAGRGLAIHFGSAGRLELEPLASAAVSAAAEGGARAFDLHGSGARVRRDGAGSAWVVRVPGAAIELDRGVLAWQARPDGPDGAAGYVELGSGRARIQDEARTELVPGQRAWVAGGRIVSAAVALSARDAPARTRSSVPTTAPSEERADSDAPRIAGRLEPQDGATPPATFTVTLLRRVRLPDVSEPQRAEFAGTLAFTIEGLRPGAYEVLVEAPGCAVWRRTDVAVAESGTTGLVVALRRERVVRGRVVEAETGAPVDSALVLAEELVPAQVLPFAIDAQAARWLAATTTGADGTFDVRGVGAEAVHLRISAVGRAARWIELPAGSEAADLGSIEVAPGGGVAGRVTRADGSPWPRATVIASRMGAGALGERMSFGVTHSDAAGEYAILDLPPGGYVVFAIEPGANATPATRDLTIRGTEVVTKDLGPTERRTRVTGIARGADGGILADLDVLLGYEAEGNADGTSWVSARTDAAGRFAFEGVEPRRYELFAGRGLGTSYALVGTLDVPLVPELRHDLQLAPGGVRGVVRAIDGAPAAGAWIVLLRRDGASTDFAGRAQADLAGRFEFLGLAPGVYVATAHAEQPGVAAVARDAIDVRATPVETELRFVPGTELVVHVVGADGRPRAGVTVDFHDEHGTAWQFTASDATDARGVLRVPGIAPGRWRIAAEGTAERVLDVERGPRIEIELRGAVDAPAPGTTAPAQPAGGKDGQ